MLPAPQSDSRRLKKNTSPATRSGGGVLFDEGGKSGVDLAFGAGLQEPSCIPSRAPLPASLE